ncbi:leukocyte elastase inhibitor isoform X3 [Stomoxys calcitrans]|uniref:leukocyte elastase inhibitor isoform X3 n=1 Tax=Stomoxys calcitrans TaxID=35570 RepID=UPI0027E39BEF|nr:leukocyte elastase inhibitor isoform X3 [Stomoxys calcitrans]
MSEIEKKFARGGAELTLELFDKLQASTNKDNILLSPLSIQTAMALAFAGAKGATADEIASAMKFVSKCPKEVAESFHTVLAKYQDSALVKIANKVYVQEGNAIKPEYATVTKEKYHAAAETVDFAKSEAAAQNINAWVENKTAGKITDLVSAESLGPDTRLVLLNALHFKGEWQEKFDEEDTREDDFWLNEEESVQVKFMFRQSNFRYGYIREFECEALELPYKDSDLSMFVLLPDKRDGLKDLAEKLKTVNLLDLDQKLHDADDMIVRFPKFKIEYSIELSDVLKEMGITTAFSNGAELCNILEAGEPIHISKVIHKSSIEVNEVGTEAAAATALEIVLCCLPMELRVDRPFFYFVWNKKITLFAGALVNPRNV